MAGELATPGTYRLPLLVPFEALHNVVNPNLNYAEPVADTSRLSAGQAVKGVADALGQLPALYLKTREEHRKAAQAKQDEGMQKELEAKYRTGDAQVGYEPHRGFYLRPPAANLVNPEWAGATGSMGSMTPPGKPSTSQTAKMPPSGARADAEGLPDVAPLPTKDSGTVPNFDQDTATPMATGSMPAGEQWAGMFTDDQGMANPTGNPADAMLENGATPTAGAIREMARLDLPASEQPQQIQSGALANFGEGGNQPGGPQLDEGPNLGKMIGQEDELPKRHDNDISGTQALTMADEQDPYAELKEVGQTMRRGDVVYRRDGPNAVTVIPKNGRSYHITTPAAKAPTGQTNDQRLDYEMDKRIQASGGDPRTMTREQKVAKMAELSKGKDLTEQEAKSAIYITRADAALKGVESVEKEGYNPAGGRGFVDKMAGGSDWTNWMASDAGQRYQTEKDNFITAILRKDSGAAITKQEMAQYESMLFPRPGDSPQAVQLKQQKRQQALKALEKGLDDATVKSIIGGGSEAAPASSQTSKSGSVSMSKGGVTKDIPADKVDFFRQRGWTTSK